VSTLSAPGNIPLPRFVPWLLAVPVLLLIGLGAAEIGNLVADTHRMKTGLAAGARLLARAQDPEDLEADAKNLAVTGTTAEDGTTRVWGWKASDVTVSYRMVANTGVDPYNAGAEVRIVRLESNIDYGGLGLFRLTGAMKVRAVHEERWTG